MRNNSQHGTTIMKNYVLFVFMSIFPHSVIANESFMNDCKKLLYKDQISTLKQTKNGFAQIRQEAKSEEEIQLVDKTEKEFFDSFENHTKSVCTCIKDEVVSSLKLIGESESNINQSLTDLGKAMLSGYYWGINEVTRSAFQEALHCGE